MVAVCPLMGGPGVRKVRLQAADMFEQDMQPVQVAHQLRVSTKSAYQWRRRGGRAAQPRWPRRCRAPRGAS